MTSTTLTRPSRPSGSGATRLRLDRRPRRRRHWLRWVALALVVVLLGTAVWLLGFSSVFATRAVDVSGTRVLTPATVLETARVPLGLPLARQDLDAVAGRVATLPQVESVTVDRTWPDAVSVAVSERTPVLALKDAGGYVLADRAGVVFDQVPTLPSGIVLAEVNRSDTSSLVAVGTVVRALPEDVRAKVETIRAASASDLVVVLDSGLSITWGDAGQSALKAEIVTALLPRKPKAMDVSAPHSPAIR